MTVPDQQAHDTIKYICDWTQERFIEHVEKHRDSKIKVTGEERKKIIYCADMFTGTRALELG
jgi:hypothetical protein